MRYICTCHIISWSIHFDIYIHLYIVHIFICTIFHGAWRNQVAISKLDHVELLIACSDDLYHTWIVCAHFISIRSHSLNGEINPPIFKYDPSALVIPCSEKVFVWYPFVPHNPFVPTHLERIFGSGGTFSPWQITSLLRQRPYGELLNAYTIKLDKIHAWYVFQQKTTTQFGIYYDFPGRSK